jgi:hypothetical protein
MIFGRGRVLSARERRTAKTGALAQVQVEDEHVWARFRDTIECIGFGVDGVDQLHGGQPINELDEAGGEQRGILDEQHA